MRDRYFRLNSIDIRFEFRKFFRKLSVRASFFALAAFLAAFLAGILGPFVPEEFASHLADQALENVLRIIASSMLVVVTFSMSTIVSAYATAAQGITPRVTKLLMEDGKSQNSISFFLGSFIFSIVSLVILSTNAYNKNELFVLLTFTALIVLMVIYSIVVWVEELSKIGRVHNAILRIEKSGEKIFRKLVQKPNFGAMLFKSLPKDGYSVASRNCGYIQNINFSNLSKLSIKLDSKIYVTSAIGNFVVAGQNLVKIVGLNHNELESHSEDEILGCFSIAESRTFDNDARFHLVVLSEIASRALSPAINDPGTAIAVIGPFVRLLSIYLPLRSGINAEYDRVFYPNFDLKDCLDDFVRPLSRDGSKYLEVMITLTRAMDNLKQISKDENDILDLQGFKQMIADRGEFNLDFSDDRNVLKEVTVENMP